MLRLAGFDPPHFDPQQTPHWWTAIALSFTHNSLVKTKAGPDVLPGTLPIEGSLAESWSQPSDTTWVFKLRPGVRWHNKPPVNGREVTAADVKYSYERAMTVKGNPNRAVVDDIDRVEALDRSTVRFTTKEPYAWFLDVCAQLLILAPEVGEKFGDFKRPETVIGTGPWMLERYDPNARLTYVRNPTFFLPGLPYADGVEITIDPDPASRFAGWLSGRYDFGPELGTVVRRIELDTAKRRNPNLQTVEFIWPVSTFAVVKLEEDPFKGCSGPPRPGHGEQLARNGGRESLRARSRCGESYRAGCPPGVVYSHRPAVCRRSPHLRTQPQGGEGPPRRCRLPERLQDAGGDDGELEPRHGGPRPNHGAELEDGRYRL